MQIALQYQDTVKAFTCSHRTVHGSPQGIPRVWEEVHDYMEAKGNGGTLVAHTLYSTPRNPLGDRSGEVEHVQQGGSMYQDIIPVDQITVQKRWYASSGASVKSVCVSERILSYMGSVSQHSTDNITH